MGGWKQWDNLDTLAAAYAENGDFEKAKEWEAKAIELALRLVNQAGVLRRLLLYKQGKPWRELP